MENYITLTVVLLEKLGCITSKESKQLCKALSEITLPQGYDAMERQLSPLMAKLRIKPKNVDTVK